MPLRYLDDGGYQLGMMRDVPSWLLPPGAVYDSLNMLHDRPGISRQRGGSTALVSGSQTAFSTSIGFCLSDDATRIEELYGVDGKTGNAYVINKTNGAATSIGTPLASGSTVGRPVRHFGFVVFPGGFSSCAVMAGQTNSTTFTNSANATITAGNPQILLTGADTTTNVKVGAYVTGSTAATAYAGRVVSIDTTKLFSVWPVPTTGLTPAAGALTTVPTGTSGSTNGGTCVTSFQNRLLFGNTFDLNARLLTSSASKADRRVNYGVLPTETGIVSPQIYTGAAGFLFAPAWPVLNYFDVPGADPIVALEPVTDNQLLILTATHPVVFSGNLVTQQSNTSPQITFDISEINVSAGCLSDLSVQRTAKGVVWAGAGGIYAWSGGRVVDLTGDQDTKLINGYWRELMSPSTAVIHGSAYVRGHYIVSGSSGGTTFSLAADLTGARVKWTRLSGVGTDNFYGVARPTIPGQVYANRWWSQSGAAPSMTNGQVVRLETMFDSYTSGTKTDADGTAVAMSLTTRVITGDTETQKIFQRGTIRNQVASTTAGVTVTAQSKIDAADIDASTTVALGSLSNTGTLTVTNATNANPIVVTTSAAHGLQTDDFVDINGVLGNLNANGRWRIAVINTTSFSLVGGIGNAAYTSGGKVKKLTETDYRMTDLNAGQGVSLTIAGSPNNIEIHGVRVAVLERPPVMSS